MLETQQKNRILVMEDEEEIGEIVTAYLQKEGYDVISADDGLAGMRLFYERRPDLVILDIMMPGLDGWEVCRRIREVSDTPVIVLSARGQESDKVRGLNLGADDYVLKPFGAAELAARVKAALRRYRLRPSSEDETYNDTVLTMNFSQRTVFVNGEDVPLSTKEFNLLSYLVQNAGRVLTHDQIMDRVWGVGGYSYANVKQYISYLRQKIEPDPVHPKLIVSVRGVGYKYAKQA